MKRQHVRVLWLARKTVDDPSMTTDPIGGKRWRANAYFSMCASPAADCSMHYLCNFLY